MTVNPPVVIDIYHGDRVLDFALTRAFGIEGVIHKATQGVNVSDPLYAHRREMAAAAGIPLWGAYSFNTGDDVAAQVRHFLEVAQPDAQTFMALDLEDNAKSEMSLGQACEFLDRLDQALGRFSWLYSGNRIKELIPGNRDRGIPPATQAQRDFLGKHPFWLCEYGAVAKMVDAGTAIRKPQPLPWPKPDLWQNAADGAGPLPHRIPGIDADGLDCNVFDGDAAALTALWPGRPLAAAVA